VRWPERRLREARVAVLEDQRPRGPKPYLDIGLARSRLQAVAWLTLIALAGAEVAVFATGRLGVLLYGVLTVVLLIAGGKTSSRRLRSLLWALGVIPTSRLIAFGAPLDQVEIEARLAVVGVLSLLATLAAIHAIGLSRAELGLVARWRQLPIYVAMVPIGVGLGIVERAVVTSLPYPDASRVAPLLIVIVLGLVDDLLMLGIVLAAARLVVGRLALLFVALLVAILHIGYGAWALTVCAALVVIVFGLVRITTGSLVGPMLGHVGLNVGLFIIGPMVAPRLQAMLSQLLTSIGIGSGRLF
jgi:hypothetical protein